MQGPEGPGLYTCGFSIEMHDYLACLYNQECPLRMDNMRLLMRIQVGRLLKVTVQASCSVKDQGCVRRILKSPISAHVP